MTHHRSGASKFAVLHNPQFPYGSGRALVGDALEFLRRRAGLAANSVYSATNTAVRSFARTWSEGLKGAPHSRAVSPDTTDTPGLNDLLASPEVSDQRKKMISNAVPVGRFGTADEIAKAVVFFASSRRNCCRNPGIGCEHPPRCSPELQTKSREIDFRAHGTTPRQGRNTDVNGPTFTGNDALNGLR
jgi:Enoyl-(Acyl carrier protein) reductase